MTNDILQMIDRTREAKSGDYVRYKHIDNGIKKATKVPKYGRTMCRNRNT